MNAKSWIVLALIVGLTGFFEYRHDLEGIPLYYAYFGVLGCLLMLFVTKGVAKKLLSRKEDYYERS